MTETKIAECFRKLIRLKISPYQGNARFSHFRIKVNNYFYTQAEIFRLNRLKQNYTS